MSFFFKKLDDQRKRLFGAAEDENDDNNKVKQTNIGKRNFQWVLLSRFMNFFFFFWNPPQQKQLVPLELFNQNNIQ